jgi:hypothetical protein
LKRLKTLEFVEADVAFKEKLIADPHATLAAEGVHIPTAKLNSTVIQA